MNIEAQHHRTGMQDVVADLVAASDLHPVLPCCRECSAMRAGPFGRPALVILQVLESDPDLDLHAEIVARKSDEGAGEGCPALRITHDCDADQPEITDRAARRVEIDPAGARQIDLQPGMRVAPGLAL